MSLAVPGLVGAACWAAGVYLPFLNSIDTIWDDTEIVAPQSLLGAVEDSMVSSDDLHQYTRWQLSN